MATLLRIDVSPRGAQSHSRRFADELVQVLAGKRGLRRTVVRDLGAGPATAIDEAYVRAMHAHATPAPTEGVPQLTLSEQLIGELETSDILVISTPVHNYTVPASLKAWIDQVVRIGRTFKSTPQGKIGRLWIGRPTSSPPRADTSRTGRRASPISSRRIWTPSSQPSASVTCTTSACRALRAEMRPSRSPTPRLARRSMAFISAGVVS